VKPIPYGEWDGLQTAAAYNALKAHGSAQITHPFVSPRSPDIVWERIVRGELRAAFVAGYFLVYDIGPTWCSEDDVLHELMLKHALPGGTFSEAVEGMRVIAQVNGCIGILSGNGVLRDGLRRLYERRGFVKLNEAYFLEV